MRERRFAGASEIADTLITLHTEIVCLELLQERHTSERQLGADGSRFLLIRRPVERSLFGLPLLLFPPSRAISARFSGVSAIARTRAA